jgi:hypothetical protein
MAEKTLAVLDSTPAERAAMVARSRELVRQANYADSAKGFVDAARCAASRKGRR